MLGVFARLQQACHQRAGGHANGVTPMDQPLWRPLHVGAVGGRQVFWHRSKSTLVRTAQVGRHTLSSVQQLHRARRDAGLQHLPNQ